MPIGHDKLIRLYDLNAPDAAPQTLPQAAACLRHMAWLQDDKILACTLLDTPGIKWVLASACRRRRGVGNVISQSSANGLNEECWALTLSGFQNWQCGVVNSNPRLVSSVMQRV